MFYGRDFLRLFVFDGVAHLLHMQTLLSTDIYIYIYHPYYRFEDLGMKPERMEEQAYKYLHAYKATGHFVELFVDLEGKMCVCWL